MATRVNMSLDESINKRKTEEPRGSRGPRPFKRGGFKSRGDRRDRGGFRKSFSGPRRFGGRDRFDRDWRGPRDREFREPRERREKVKPISYQFPISCCSV